MGLEEPEQKRSPWGPGPVVTVPLWALVSLVLVLGLGAWAYHERQHVHSITVRPPSSTRRRAPLDDDVEAFSKLREAAVPVRDMGEEDSLEEALAKLEGGRSARSRSKRKAKAPEESDEIERPAPQAREVQKEEPSEDEQLHFHFAEKLKEEGLRKLDFDLKTVKREFKTQFGNDARTLMCSGCKLVASRLTGELDTHDVHEQESPAHMLEAKRKAIDATCSSLRHLKAVLPENGDGKPHFEADEDPTPGPVEFGQISGQRLCSAILQESRFDLLARLIQRKVPELSSFYMHHHAVHDNWERWLCAERTRLCKRSEVREDDDDDERVEL